MPDCGNTASYVSVLKRLVCEPHAKRLDAAYEAHKMKYRCISLDTSIVQPSDSSLAALSSPDSDSESDRA
jgi:hypothetical protein